MFGKRQKLSPTINKINEKTDKINDGIKTKIVNNEFNLRFTLKS